MDEILRRFNGDVHAKEAFRDYLISYFKNKIIERALDKQDVSSLADAIKELNNGFEQLEIDYGIKQQKHTITHKAR